MSLTILAWKTVRKRFQFSLRSLMIITLAVGTGPGCLVAFLHQSRSQRLAATRFEQLEAQVTWAIDGRRGLKLLPGRHYFSSVSKVSFLFCPPAEDGDLALFEELTELRGVIILGEDFCDRHLRHFKDLTELEFLILHFAAVDGTGLESLQHLPNLKVLGLANSMIDDGNAELISRCTSLEVIGLTETEIGDAGIAYLARMPHLTELQLESTLVSDAGLEHLAAMGNLKKLNLRKTRVTKHAVNRLQKRLPGCDIVW